jgi:hypothetical protein
VTEVGAFIRHGGDGLHVLRIELFHFASLMRVQI